MKTPPGSGGAPHYYLLAQLVLGSDLWQRKIVCATLITQYCFQKAAESNSGILLSFSVHRGRLFRTNKFEHNILVFFHEWGFFSWNKSELLNKLQLIIQKKCQIYFFLLLRKHCVTYFQRGWFWWKLIFIANTSISTTRAKSEFQHDF